jgi:mRNA degradation ribonuclease J1/J2
VLETTGASSGMRNKIRDALQQFCYVRTGRRPLILPLVIEI